MENISPRELDERIKAGEHIKLIDVREPWENEEFNIGGDLIPLAELLGKLGELDSLKGQTVVVYCKSGNRSQMAQNLLLNSGFEDVLNLEGGIEAWMMDVDGV
jgi:rhodanese-related sulfurtransferase